MKFIKKLSAISAALIMMSTLAISANAVTLDRTFDVKNSYLESIQTYSYNSDTVTTSVKNHTICFKDNYGAILSCAEILYSSEGGTYKNATNYLPYANTGTFLSVTASANVYYEGYYARHWSYVRDANDNNKGETDVKRKITF